MMPLGRVEEGGGVDGNGGGVDGNGGGCCETLEMQKRRSEDEIVKREGRN